MKFIGLHFICLSFFLWNANAEKCPSNCENISFRGLINNIWELCGDMTPLLNNYKNNLISLTNFGETYQSMISRQTVLAIERFTNFQLNISMSCMYANLIKQTLLADYGKINLDQYNESWRDFLKYSITAYDNDVLLGLTSAGCISSQKYIPTLEECSIDEDIFMYLKTTNGIPKRLKSIIRNLLISDIPRERDIGLIAAASSISRMTNIFNEMFSEKSYVDTLLLKGCDIKIPVGCCRSRGKQLQKNANSSKRTLLRIFNESKYL